MSNKQRTASDETDWTVLFARCSGWITSSLSTIHARGLRSRESLMQQLARERGASCAPVAFLWLSDSGVVSLEEHFDSNGNLLSRHANSKC